MPVACWKNMLPRDSRNGYITQVAGLILTKRRATNLTRYFLAERVPVSNKI
jgi:hypothetical protein